MDPRSLLRFQLRRTGGVGDDEQRKDRNLPCSHSRLDRESSRLKSEQEPGSPVPPTLSATADRRG